MTSSPPVAPNLLGLPATHWARPSNVVMRQGNIVTPLRPRDADLVMTTAKDTLLPDFVGLADATDARVLAFVRRWGVLGRCPEHGLTASATVHLNGEGASCFRGLRRNLIEPVESYRQLAAQFAAVRQFVRTIEQRSRKEQERGPQRLPRLRRDYDPLPEPAFTDRLGIPAAKWSVFDPLFPEFNLGAVTGTGDTVRMAVGDEKLLLAEVVRRLLTTSDVGLTLTWGPLDSSPRLSVGGAGMLSVLTLRLAQEVAQMASLPVCEDCLEVYKPLRQSDRNRWCPDCRPSASKREEARRRRARERAAVEAQPSPS